ncbi:MAG: ABC transporter permease [Capsulimonadaceae bacterium]
MNALLFGFRSVAIKEILHLRRDPATFVIAMMIPMVQLTIFGFAANFDVRHIATVVVDYDHSQDSRAFVQSLHNTEYADVAGYVATPAEAVAAMRRGTARMAVIIPADYARTLAAGGRPQVRVLIDGSDSQVALRAREAVLVPNAAGPVDVRAEAVFNPDMRTQVFMIPGLIAVILQLVTVSLTAFSLVREREQGTLEQMMVTPVGRLGLMLGKLAPYAAIGFTEMLTVLFIGRVVFDVRVAGSVWLLLLLSLPFLIAALSLGLLISTVAQNQTQALQFTMLITMPSILMSGFVFPRETMPGVLYLVSDAIPVTYFMNIIRGIVVRGAGLADVWPDAAALLLISTILIAVSTARFGKSLG